MNRIRDIRLRRGLTLTELADRVGTTAGTISRLELGTRQLTEDWMRRLAHALEVHPAELLEVAAFAEIDSDVEPVTATNGMASALRALESQGFTTYRVTGDSVIRAGIEPGAIIAVDTRPDSRANVSTGDVVVVEIRRDQHAPVLALRQWIAPGMLVTNRGGPNITLDLDDSTGSLHLTVVGVVMRQD